MSHRRFPRRIAALTLLAGLAVAAPVALVAGGSLVACDSSSDLPVLTPITGVIVRSETLTRSLGCGVDGDEMYKYAARVVRANPPNEPVTSGVYDCFADATIVSLLADDAGSLDFKIEIYAFSKASFDAQIAAAPGTFGTTPSSIDTAFQNEANVAALQPTWSVLCTATQQRDVRVLAVCGAASIGRGAFDGTASPKSGGFTLPLDTLTTETGGRVYCDSRFVRSTYVAHTASTGAQSDGLRDLTGGLPCAPAGTTLDAGAPVSDAGVADDASPTDGGDAAPPPPPPVVPATISASPAVAPARFTIDVTLYDLLDLPARTVTCTADASGGVTTRAVCGAVREAP